MIIILLIHMSIILIINIFMIQKMIIWPDTRQPASSTKQPSGTDTCIANHDHNDDYDNCDDDGDDREDHDYDNDDVNDGEDDDAAERREDGSHLQIFSTVAAAASACSSLCLLLYWAARPCVLVLLLYWAGNWKI